MPETNQPHASEPIADPRLADLSTHLATLDDARAAEWRTAIADLVRVAAPTRYSVYRHIRNFLVNDLKIDATAIRGIVAESAEPIVRQWLAERASKGGWLDQMIRAVITELIRARLPSDVHTLLRERIKIEVVG